MPTWTEERIALLKELHAEGISFGIIADRLGVTRNATIGKSLRIGLSRREKSFQPTMSKPSSKRIKRPPGGDNAIRAANLVKGKRPGCSGPQIATKIADAVEEAIESDVVRDLPPEILSPHAVTILELTEETCRWPIGNPGSVEFRFCGNRIDEGCPYCLGHRRIAYTGLSKGKYSDSFVRWAG